jgi:amino acid transporter
MHAEKIGGLVGLAVFASDGLSSVAYATEEILLALVLAGTSGLPYVLPVGIAIGALIMIVAFSYRQTCLQYPNGGGAYIVAKDNLGTMPGLTAAAALLVDYILTVAVSITSGVAALISAFPELEPYRVALALVVIAFIALMNLRGVRESGAFFAGPTYVFVVSMFVLIAVGLWRTLTGSIVPVPDHQIPAAVQTLTLFLVLRAFASGCAALTGIEAVANGITAFKEPASQRAAKVLIALATLLLLLFMGTTWLAHHYHIVPSHTETVVSQIASQTFGRNWIYFVIQTSTFVILFLAANTSFNGFPRLASLLAQDGYLPRQLTNLGDRLVFGNGIMLLALTAGVLVVIFQGSTHALIPLYAIGVFLAFTLSQAGMVVRWWRRRDRGWQMGILVNSVGALTTFVVLSVVLIAKFTQGAWVVSILLPLLVMEFLAIEKHYKGVARLLRLEKFEKVPVRPTTVLVPVAGLHRGVLRALRFAAGLGCPAKALHVATDEGEAQKLQRQWDKLDIGIPLVMLESPYRSLAGPVVEYVDKVIASEPEGFVAVVIPEFVPSHWRHAFLHNQSALLLEFTLRTRPQAVLISVRYLLSAALQEETREREAAQPPAPAATPPAGSGPSPMAAAPEREGEAREA